MLYENYWKSIWNGKGETAKLILLFEFWLPEHSCVTRYCGSQEVESAVFHEKLIVWRSNLFYNFELTIVFTRACHWTLYWARWVESNTSHPISVWSISVLSYLGLRLQRELLTSNYLNRIIYAFLTSLMPRHITCLIPHSSINHLNIICWRVQAHFQFSWCCCCYSSYRPTYLQPWFEGQFHTHIKY